MSRFGKNVLTDTQAPLVSVIIPTFNRAWTVGSAIDSVIVQNYPNFELIVVDDGSSDHTPALLSAYKDAILPIHQPNRGVSAARNRGIAAASGDLIAFLDSDDYWLPGKLSEQVAFFKAHPAAWICQTEEIWIRNGRRVNPRRRHKKPAGDIFIPSLELCLVSPSAVMAKKALFVEIGGFDENLPACEDYDLWLRVSSRYSVHLIEKPLIVKQGGHPDQLSRQPGLDKYRIFAIEKMLAGRSLTDEQYRAAVKALEEKCAIYAAGCRKRGKNGEADEYWRLARKYTGEG